MKRNRWSKVFAVIIASVQVYWGCAPAEDPEVAAILDSVKCPVEGTGAFFLNSTSADLAPFEGATRTFQYSVLQPIAVTSRRGDRLVIAHQRGPDAEGVRLTVAEGDEGRVFCGGQGTIMRDETFRDGSEGSTIRRIRVVMRNLSTGPDCDANAEGEIRICVTN